MCAQEMAVGIDIGGTTVVGAVVRGADAGIVARRTMPTDSRRGIEDGLRRIRALIDGLLKDAGIELTQIIGIGIGSTGPIDAVTGRINNPFTLPGWEHIPIVNHLRGIYDLPVCLLGDCQVAALGEHWNGAGRGTRTMLYVTFGTGIGGGFIVNDQLYRGVGDATEIGHHTIDYDGPPCYCGAFGCWEMLASGPAIAQMAAETAPDDSLILALAEHDRGRITAEMVSIAARQSDPFALELVKKIGFYIGTGVSNMINILAPEAIVLGGGVMQGWDVLGPSVLQTVAARDKMVPLNQIKIAPAALGLNAGVTGAARAAFLFVQGAL
ncbi:MAG: ROK family protein [Aggregatilineales bacterium]